MLRTSSLMTITFLLSLLKYKSDVLTQNDVLRNCRRNSVWLSILACDHPRAECWSFCIRHKIPLISAFHIDPPPILLACVRLIIRHLVFLALALDQAGLCWQGWQTLGHAKKQRESENYPPKSEDQDHFPLWLSQGYKEAGEETGNWALAVSPGELRGECRNKQPAGIMGRYLNLRLCWRWSIWGPGCWSVTGRRSARVWLEAELGFSFPCCLALVWKTPSCISNLLLLHPNPPPLINPPSCLGTGTSWNPLSCLPLSRILVLSDVQPACIWAWQTWPSQWIPVPISAPPFCEKEKKTHPNTNPTTSRMAIILV